LNLKINFDSRVQKANVQTKNRAQSTNKSISLTIYIIAQEEINDFLIHKLINQKSKAQANKKIENFHKEKSFFFDNRYATGGKEEINAQIVTHQFVLIHLDHIPNISR